MKTLILCAGKGSRLYPLTHLLPKALLPVADKPLLVHNLEKLAAAGFREIGLVVNPQNREIFFKRLGNGERWDVNLTYLIQEQPLGLAHAVQTGKQYLKDAHRFLVVLGDNLFGTDLKHFWTEYLASGTESQIMLIEVADPGNYGVAKLSGNRIIELIEKPAQPESNCAVAGVYGFSQGVFNQIEKLRPSLRGELELTDAIQRQIVSGLEIRAYFTDQYWHDVGNINSLLEANREFLKKLVPKIQPRSNENCSISGSVVIFPNCNLTDTSLEGPVLLGEGCSLDNCRIGPNVVIGRSVKLRQCAIENSLIMEGTYLEGLGGPITGSVIGADSMIIEVGKGWKTMVLGANSRLII